MIFEIANTGADFMVVATILSLAFLLPERDGLLTLEAQKTEKFLFLSSGFWFIAAIGNFLSTLSQIFDSPINEVLKWNVIRSFATQITLGKLLTFQIVMALLIFILGRRVKKNGGAIWLLIAALAGVLAPVFQSHSSALGSHGLAIGSLVIHVLGLSMWIGAVVALLLMSAEAKEVAFSRVSSIALWSSAAVVMSGAMNAWTRLRLSQDWFTSYGALIAMKVGLTIVVLVIASRMREKITVNQLLPFEVAVLVAIMSIGAILNRFTPVEDVSGPFDKTRELVGISMPDAPTLNRVFFEYEANGLILGLLIFVTALYIRGVVALSRRGVKWPVGRTISFAIGISLLDYATSGGLGLYAHFSFQYHMMAHMVLSMIAPIAIILSAPITLALRTLPIGRNKEERGIRGLFLSLLHSKLYFTPLFGELMSSHFGHMAMDLHFIAAGLLFFHVIVGIDPNPRRVHHLVRIVMLLAAMSIHAFFSVALMSASSLIDGGYYALLERPWATDLLSDQKVGAAIGWAMGEIPIVVALIATFIQWMRSDAREANRADKRSAVDLAEYNEYLRKLSSREDK